MFSLNLVERKDMIYQPPLTHRELNRLMKQSKFPKHTIHLMSCIAEKESILKPNAIHKNHNNTIDFGLMQINSIWLKECNVTEKDLMNPVINIRCAYIIYKRQGVNAWVTRRLCGKG
jgi:lysozyme-like protein